ncbi:unnamed protein product [Cylicocyclus nassatus]|uniref:Uncharacterized protein n=1 Tax=Cylicocyclus nassatus TaxID=53992 RepID=A0AA36GN12_CYLNA|nr:unnamed protein product [Cylicocyclus nassatus]
MIDLFKTSRIASLIMIDCEIPASLAEWLEREFVPTICIGASRRARALPDDGNVRTDQKYKVKNQGKVSTGLSTKVLFSFRMDTLDKYYIGSSHSFINYGDNKILTDDWLTALLQKMHGSESVDKDDEFISLGIPHRFSNLGSYEDQDEITKRYIAHLIKIQKNAC